MSARTDVLVIGAGIAGLLIASRLQRDGIRTVVVESGTEGLGPDPHPLNEVVLDGEPVHAALCKSSVSSRALCTGVARRSRAPETESGRFAG